MAEPILDKNGIEIKVGDWVSLAGNMTADDTMGALPNGWFFEAEDVYEVYFDERIGTLSLHLGVEPDSAYNAKYMNHALNILHGGMAEITQEPDRRTT